MFIWNLIWHPSIFKKRLKTKCWLVGLFDLRRKINSWACLLGSGSKLIFHWKAQSSTFSSHYLTLLQKFLHRERLKIMMYHQQKVSHWKSNHLITGPILESKGMDAIFRKRAKKCRNRAKYLKILDKKCTKFENILKKSRWLHAIIPRNKLLE